MPETTQGHMQIHKLMEYHCLGKEREVKKEGEGGTMDKQHQEFLQTLK